MVFSMTLSGCLLFLGVNLVLAASSGGYDVIGGWSEWTCQKNGKLCYNVRTCNSSDTFTCPPKHNEVVLTNCPCGPEWGKWGSWLCHPDPEPCIQIRYRVCLNNYTKEDCENTGGKHFDIIPCDNTNCRSTSFSAPTQTTTKQNQISPNTSSTTTIGTQPSIYWLDWSAWYCNKSQQCIISRTRNCSTSNRFDCENIVGLHIEEKPCKNGTCPEWDNWGTWKCHSDKVPCIQIRYRNCMNNYTKEDCELIGDRHFHIIPCDNTTCKSTLTIKPTLQTTKLSTELTTKISAAAAITTTMTSSPTVTSKTTLSNATLPHTAINDLTTIEPPISASPYIYWLEWTGWECKENIQNKALCVMSRTRNCSTFKTADCEKKLGGEHYKVVPCQKEICPVRWSEWSGWSCRVESFGVCNMTRSRKCSTGSTVDCGKNSLEHKPCDKTTCFDLYTLTQSGYCNKFGPRNNCSNDDSVCDYVDKKGSSMCYDEDIATIICPKACGCCQVDPLWSSWSSWTCIRTSTMCKMKQNRTCSTGNTTDCVGMSEKEAICDPSICPETKWSPWSVWKCHLRSNNTCTMSRNRQCENGDQCQGPSHEDKECTSEHCPDFLGYKVDCNLFDTRTDVCRDGVGCYMFEEAPRSVCSENLGPIECPVTCGCCQPSMTSTITAIPGISSTMPASGLTGTVPNVTTMNPGGVSTVNPSGSSGTGVPGTGSNVTTINPGGVSTANPSGSSGTGVPGTGSNVTTTNPGGGSTANPSGSIGTGVPGTGSNVTTMNPGGGSTANPSGSSGTGVPGMGSSVTTMKPGDVSTANPSGSNGTGVPGTGSSVTTMNPGGVSTANPSGSSGTGVPGTGSNVTTMNPGGGSTASPSGSNGTGVPGTGSSVTSMNPGGVSTANPSGSSGTGVPGTGSNVTTMNPGGVSTANPSGSNGTGVPGTGSSVTTMAPEIGSTANPSGSSGTGVPGTGSSVTTMNPVGGSTVNPSGSNRTGVPETGSNVTTMTPGGVSTANPLGSSGTSVPGTGSNVTTINQGGSTASPSGSNGTGVPGTGSSVTTMNPGGVSTANPSGSSETILPGTGSNVTTMNPGGVSTANPSGSNGTGVPGTGSNVTTMNPGGVSTANPSGSSGTILPGTGSNVTTMNPGVGSTANPSGSNGTGVLGTGSNVTTMNPGGVSTANPSGPSGTGAPGTGSSVITQSPGGASTHTPSVSSSTDVMSSNPLTTTLKSSVVTSATTTTPLTVATTSLAVKTTTHKQPHTPKPDVVRCNVCVGPEFLCEKLYEEQECAPPNNYCINKLTNHIDGTRMVTRHCGNFDTCYREWFLGSSDSDKCRNFEEDNIITLDFDCTYCCTVDGCNLPIKPSDSTLYKDL